MHFMLLTALLSSLLYGGFWLLHALGIPAFYDTDVVVLAYAHFLP